MRRLYTFHISHFSEKARWALDFAGVPYQETVLVPGPHQLVTRRIAPKSHVPVLIDDGRVVQQSSAIIDHVSERLGGSTLSPRDPREAAAARNLEAELDHALGSGAQCVLYAAMLPRRRDVIELWANDGPFWARPYLTLAYPLVAGVVSRMYKCSDPAAVEQAKAGFYRTFDQLDERLRHRRYLGGDAPDRRDITLAALLAPLCLPPEHRVKWPALPPALDTFVAQLRDRPTWNHVLHMYREHRAPAHRSGEGRPADAQYRQKETA